MRPMVVLPIVFLMPLWSYVVRVTLDGEDFDRRAIREDQVLLDILIFFVRPLTTMRGRPLRLCSSSLSLPSLPYLLIGLSSSSPKSPRRAQDRLLDMLSPAMSEPS